MILIFSPTFILCFNDVNIFTNLYIQILSIEDVPSGSLQDIDAPQYNNMLMRVVVTVDKGGQVVRWGVELFSNGLHIVGAYEGYDNHRNMQAFLNAEYSWMDQLEDILKTGLTYYDIKSQQYKTKEVQLLWVCDKAAISEGLGLQGSASKYPITWDLTTSDHLRKGHLDGSPHSPNNPMCQFEPRTLEGMELDLLNNLRDTRKKDTRSRGSLYHSVVAERIFPMRSLDDVCCSVLHLWLSLGQIITTWIGVQCRIKDGLATEAELAKVATECEWEMNFDEDDLTLEHQDNDPQLPIAASFSDAMLKQRAAFAEAEGRWMEQAAKVEQLQETTQKLCDLLKETDFLRNRVKWRMDGDEKKIEAEVKKMTKLKKQNLDFQKCQFLCLLCKYDVCLDTTSCDECGTEFHTVCGLNNQRETELGICSKCRGLGSFSDLLKILDAMWTSKQEEFRQTSALLSSATLELEHKKDCVRNFMGPSEQEFEDLLQKLGCKRTDFASCSWVGNHVEIIVNNYDTLAKVLPEDVKEEFLKFGAVIKRLQPLTKKKSFLTPEELDQVERDCLLVGELYPRVFKGNTITPKV